MGGKVMSGKRTNGPARAKPVPANGRSDKSLESWLWNAACSIRGVQDAAKYKDFILPLVFTKRLCDVFDDDLNRIAEKVGSRSKAFELVARDHSLVRFYLPLKPEVPSEPVWSVIRATSSQVGERITAYLRDIARANPRLDGIIDRVDFSATTHGQRDLDDDRLSDLIDTISDKRLGLGDVEPDIIGRSYEYLIGKFAEGAGQSAGEFYTPREVGVIMARIMAAEPGMTVYDPCCGSAGLLIKCQLALDEAMRERGITRFAPLQLYGQEYIGNTWAMANMNMIIHGMAGQIEIGDTFRNPRFRTGNNVEKFDRVVANPMWNQDWFEERDYDADQLGRFPRGAGFPGKQSADWGWMQHILASLNDGGRAAVVLDTQAASRGSGSANRHKERDVRAFFVDRDLVEGVVYLPENLFYNTPAPGILVLLNRQKSGEQNGQVLVVNASQVFARRGAKNYIPDEGIDRIVDVYRSWKQEETFSRIVSVEQIADSDYNIMPPRYVHRADTRTHRPVAEILADMDALEAQSLATTRRLRAALAEILR
ncbi:MAG: type I restriction-modification system subunit M [Proteobacteria bacterium]|nr:type I restriction-modification system subunit M [Pseudomonadota bacterium]